MANGPFTDDLGIPIKSINIWWFSHENHPRIDPLLHGSRPRSIGGLASSATRRSRSNLAAPRCGMKSGHHWGWDDFFIWNPGRNQCFLTTKKGEHMWFYRVSCWKIVLSANGTWWFYHETCSFYQPDYIPEDKIVYGWTLSGDISRLNGLSNYLTTKILQ